MVFLLILARIFHSRMLQPKFKTQYIVIFCFMTVYGLVGWYQPTGGVYCLHLSNRSGMSFYVLNTYNQETTVQITFWNASYKQQNYTSLQNQLKSSSILVFISSFILLLPDNNVTYSWLIYKICHISTHEISYKEIPP